MELSNQDEISRLIFKPYHYKSERIVFDAFVPPPGSNEISINIIKLASYNDICSKGVGMQNEDKKLQGLGLFTYENFLTVDCFLDIKLDEGNVSDPSHGNIITNYHGARKNVSADDRKMIKDFIEFIKLKSCSSK